MSKYVAMEVGYTYKFRLRIVLKKNNRLIIKLVILINSSSNISFGRDLIKISLIDWIERLGLAEHFKEEIEILLAQLFRYLTETCLYCLVWIA